jgi:hypothetical protein
MFSRGVLSALVGYVVCIQLICFCVLLSPTEVELENTLFNATAQLVEIPQEYISQSKDARLETNLNPLAQTPIPTVAHGDR